MNPFDTSYNSSYISYDKSIYEKKYDDVYIKHLIKSFDKKRNEFVYSSVREKPRILSSNFFKRKEEDMLDLLPSI